MFRKSVMLTVMASILGTSVMWSRQAEAAPLTMYQVYAYVQREHVTNILPYVQYNNILEIEDEYGNTPLCYAMYNQDTVTVQKLIFLGANQNARCVKNLPIEVLRRYGMTSRGYGSASAYSRSRSVRSSAPPLLTRKNLFTLGVLGGLAGIALLASGGHGGGGGGIVIVPGGGGDNPPDTPVLDPTEVIPAVQDEESCPSGMRLINGVCTRSVSSYEDGTELDGTKPIVDISETLSPYYLAEFGGVISNDAQLSYLGQEGERIIAMQANGVGKDALSADGTLVYLSKASMVRNTEKGSIQLTETQATDGGVIGLYGTSAGTIKNEGNITITSKSHAESAGMKVDRDASKPISIVGAGANVNNTGTITVIDQGDGMGTLSAISAPSRSVTNKGTINISLDTTGGAINEDTKGTAQGIYGRNIVNDGTISLTTNGSSANKPINTEAYLIRGYGDPGSTVANTGALNIDLTNIAWNIYGLWSDEAATYGTSVKNKGTIDVTGALYNDTGSDETLLKAKHVFLVGSEGGVVDLDNSGTINVGTADTPIDISLGGIMNALYGYSGYVYNSGKLNFHLKADPTQSSKAFSALAMSLDRGIMVNDADITYSFSNKLPGITTTNQVIQLTAISSSSATITNNANITATLTGVAAHKTEELGGRSRFTAMRSIQSDLLNTGKIAVTSDMNNMDLIGLVAPTGGRAVNSNTGKIVLTTSGYNSDLMGADVPAGGNSGSVYLTHNGGSGDIVGFDGGNQGLIQINADDMTGDSFITGGETWEAISEVGESSDPDTTAEVRGMINISLTGRTSGGIHGYDYKGNAKNEGDSNPVPPNYTSANTINITAEDGYRVGDLNVTGLQAITYNVDSEDAGVVSLSRDGTMTLNVLASSNPNYHTGVVGLWASDSNITNLENSVVNLNVNLNNSTKHLIVGMQLVDTSIKPNKETFKTDYYNEFRATNAGTLNLNITGAGAVPNVADERPAIPFDIVGMLTNSYALNTGTINLNVSSMTAKTAGMVAHYGGLIVNAGTINFTGNAANFVPMYASGHRQIREDGEEQPSPTITIETARQRDFWGTIYNFGRIIVTHDTTDLTPQGNGYFSTNPAAFTDDSGNFNLEGTPASDVWAKRDEFLENTCQKGESGEECAITDYDLTDTRDDFTKFGDPIVVKPIEMVEVTTTDSQSGSSAPDINPAEPTDTTTTPTTPTIATSVAQTPSMLINNGMRYVSEKGGSFAADGVHLLGDVAAGKTLVQGTNANTYVASGEGSGVIVGDGDFSDLNLSSDSVMFKASYAQNATNANGADIVMQRKSFYEMLGNASLAGYLERNYAMGNNVAFFDQLKSFNKLNNLNNALDRFTGKDVLSRFNFEDLTMMRELNFDMNDKIFHNNEDVMQVAGFVKPLAFKGDIGSDAKYSLLYKNHGDYSVGVGMAFANIRSDDGHKDNKRQEMLYQMNVPIGTKILGAHVVTSPRLGYARGSYTRTGFDESNYKGTLEKRVFGLANEIRYPMVFGSWTVEPVSEFNILGYNQRGKEDNKAYSLQVKSQNTYSVEGGVGLYMTKTANLAKDSTLKLSSGVVMYHEFADPYKLDVGMTGMDGTFTLRDETHSQNRAVARFGFDYNRENLSLYGALTSFIDDEVRTNVKSGMNWKF